MEKSHSSSTRLQRKSASNPQTKLEPFDRDNPLRNTAKSARRMVVTNALSANNGTPPLTNHVLVKQLWKLASARWLSAVGPHATFGIKTSKSENGKSCVAGCVCVIIIRGRKMLGGTISWHFSYGRSILAYRDFTLGKKAARMFPITVVCVVFVSGFESVVCRFIFCTLRMLNLKFEHVECEK